MRKVLYILGQLDDADVEWLANNGRREQLPKGSVVIENGKKSENLYIVIDGRLAVVLPNGFRLAEVGVGEILGEISLVISSPPTASPASPVSSAQMKRHAASAVKRGSSCGRPQMPRRSSNATCASTSSNNRPKPALSSA